MPRPRHLVPLALLLASMDAAPAEPGVAAVPVAQVRRTNPLEPGERPTIPLVNETPPLLAPQSFGANPPPVTEEELQKHWLLPDPKDLDAQGWRASSPARFATLSADFDGDGKPDRAVLRVGTTGWKEGLFVQLSSVLPDMWQPVNSVVHDEQSPRLVMGISLAPPGTYATACGKGYGRCEPGEPREVVLKHPGISYFQYETSSSFVFWDGERRQLRRVWISD